MATDPATLTDPAKLRVLARNARRLGRDDLALACSARIAELTGQAHDSDVEREFWQAVIVAEELRSLENGRTTRLSRTRQKVARVGVLVTVSDLANAKNPSEGFFILARGGRLDLTAESIVLRHPEQFGPDVILAARRKIDGAANLAAVSVSKSVGA